jgi:uncharacterized protein YndB with AHSA1/START domain
MQSTDTSVVLTRLVPAGPDAIFAAWTDPELLSRWLAPAPCEVKAADAEPHVGGSYRLVVADPAGRRHVTTGTYLELHPGRRLVQTWVYQGPAPGGPSASLLRVELRAIRADLTEVTLSHEGLSAQEEREEVQAGWVLCLEQLEALVSRGRTSEA